MGNGSHKEDLAAGERRPLWTAQSQVQTNKYSERHALKGPEKQMCRLGGLPDCRSFREDWHRYVATLLMVHPAPQGLPPQL